MTKITATKIYNRNVNVIPGAQYLVDGNPINGSNGVLLNNVTVSTISTAAAVTYTAAQVTGGFILRDPNGGGRSDVTPTAEALLELLNPVIGSGFVFTIRNTADAAETITVTAGTGVTLSGTMTVAQNNSKEFLVVCTNAAKGSAAFTVYSLGTSTT